MQMELTAVFEYVPEGVVAFVGEFPGANTQGATLEEARANLQEAVLLILDANRAMAEQQVGDRDVMKEPFRITACSGST